MAKTSKYPIDDILADDWGAGIDGLPHSGEQVQSALKEKLADMQSKLNELIGDGSKELYRLGMRNNMASASFSVNMTEECVLDYMVVSQVKHPGANEWVSLAETCDVRVLVRDSMSEDYVTVTGEKPLQVQSNVRSLFDVTAYLTAGSTANYIRIEVTGLFSGKSATFTYAVTKSDITLSKAPSFSPFQTSSINLISSGNVQRRLSVVMTDGAGNVLKEDTKTYPASTRQINYEPEIAAMPHGVYTFRFTLSNLDGTITTPEVALQVLHIEQGSDVPLVAVNSVMSELSNYAANTPFVASVYTGYNDSTTPYPVTFSLEDEAGNVLVKPATYQALNDVEYPYTFELEHDTEMGGDFKVTAYIRNASGETIKSLEFNVANSASYAATPDAAFFLNPKNRSNSQDNHLDVINEADGSSVTGNTWENFNWLSDGWQEFEGEKVLKVPAGHKATLNYKPFNGTEMRNGKTIELDYLIEPLGDRTQTAIAVASDVNGAGLRISAQNISLASNFQQNLTDQDVNTQSDTRLRATVVIMPDVEGHSEINIAFIYINGKRNRAFAFSDADGWSLLTSDIVIGCEDANVYIYGIRTYNTALSPAAVQQNYTNRLGSRKLRDEEIKANDVLDASGSQVDFRAVKGKKNVFVFDKPFPSLRNNYTAYGTLEVIWAKDSGNKDFIATEMQAKGQGTSSKEYDQWNERFRPSQDGHKTMVSYDGGDTWAEASKVEFFAGMKPMEKLTAKKNWASSMQDHKCGTVNSYTDLWNALGLTNEAHDADPSVRVSVKQEPFLGFYKSTDDEGNAVYTFMGEFTFGSDKGDKPTFGYDNSSLKSKLISMEGSDNGPWLTQFRVPWNTSKPYIIYQPSEEAMCYNGAPAWDFDAGNAVDKDGKKVDSDADECVGPANIQSFIDAYNAVYLCSPAIKPFTGTLDQLNAQAAEYVAGHQDDDIETDTDAADGKFYGTAYEYWLPDHNLYYYEAVEGKYIPSDIGEGQINLATQLADYVSAIPSGPAEANQAFIDARVKLFRATAPQYWDIDDAVFCRNHTLLTAGTDERAKNTYPYSFGGVWRWRKDDTDTIWPIENRGDDTKPYYCEFQDRYDNGQNIWNGSKSVFWNLIDLAYDTDQTETEPSTVAKGMTRMLDAMCELGGGSGSTMDRLMAWYDKYYLSIKQYFPSTLVNADAQLYVDAYITRATEPGKGQAVNPLMQLHGDFLTTEYAWVFYRMMYICSKYGYGDFSAKSTNTIEFRGSGNGTFNFNLTPAEHLYPAMTNGVAYTHYPDRVSPGETVTIPQTIETDQSIHIIGVEWMKSIGDLHRLLINGEFKVSGRNLQEIVLGSKTDTVICAITSLDLSNCISMRKIDVSNLTTLGGELLLAGSSTARGCEAIEEVYAKGTNIRSVTLPVGGVLKHLELPAGLTALIIRGHNQLLAENMDIEDSYPTISRFWVEGCPDLDAVSMFVRCIQSEDSAMLKGGNVRLVGFSVEVTPAVAHALGQIEGAIGGIDADGFDTPHPVVEGTVTTEHAYESDKLNLRKLFGERFELKVTGDSYVPWSTDAIAALASAKWGDGVGVLGSALVDTTIGNTFIDESVTKFADMKNFTGNVSLRKVFTNDTSLEEFDGSGFDGVITDFGWNFNNLEEAAFRGCTNLKVFNAPNWTIAGDVMWGGAFQNLDSLDTLDLSSWKVLGKGFNNYNSSSAVFSGMRVLILPNNFVYSCEIFSCLVGGRIETVITNGFKILQGYSMFCRCRQLKNITPNDWDMSECTNVRDMFSGCWALETLNVPSWDMNMITQMQGFCNDTKMSFIRLGRRTTMTDLNLSQVFYNAGTNLTEIDMGNVSGTVTDLTRAFQNDSNLATIHFGTMDWSKIGTNAALYCFYGCKKLTTITGTFRNIKVNLSGQQWYLNDAPLTRESALVFINGLYDYAAEGNTETHTITFSSTTKGYLTDDDVELITDKGWTLA